MPSSGWPRQPFIGIAFSAISGIAIADCAPSTSATTIVLVIGLGVCGLVLRRTFFTYLIVSAAFFYLHSARVTDSSGLRLARAIGSGVNAVSVRGVVVSEPKTAASSTATFLLALETLDLDGVPNPARGRLLVRWKHEIEFGDEVELFGTVEPIPGARNPGEFDLRAYLVREDVHRQLFVRYAENGRLVRHTRGNLLMRAAQRSRAWLRQTLTRDLDDSPDVQGLINGMVLGLRHQTPDDIEEPFQQTGTLHLFAVAGLHVGIVAQLLWLLAKIARLPRKWATALIIPLLFFYAAVTGFHTASVRAAVMSGILLSGVFVERRVFALNSLAIAAVALLVWDTNELFTVGYQLSFSVVATILLGAEPTFRFLRRRLAADPFLPRVLFNRAGRARDRITWWLARAGSVSFASWIGSSPLMFWYYHLVTPISLFANLAVVPIAFFVLAGALVSVVFAPLSTALSVIFNNANWCLSQAILFLVHLFSLLPIGHLYLQRPHWPTGARLEITALDLGTGAAIHLRTSQQDWLIDAGSRRDFRRTVREYLRARGTNRLDGLLLSHGDAAHIGGAADVLEVFCPRHVFDTAAHDRSPLHRRFTEVVQARGVSVNFCATGDHFSLGHGVEAQVLFPPRGFEADAADDQAVVLQLIVEGKIRVLLMSDSGDATERALLGSGADLRSDLLIKGQHRSGVSASPDFLEAVKPDVIIATSRDFPESERLQDDWLAAVRARGVRLLRQDETGAVTVEVFRNRWEARGYLTPEILRSRTR